MSEKEAPPALGTGGTAAEQADSHSYTYPAGLRRRREASRRLPVLESGRSDPWFYQPLPPTDCQLDGWDDAIAYLADHGLTAIVPASVQRALREREDAV